MDIEGARRRRSHEPTAVRLELGLGWPESTSLDRDKMPGRVTRLLRMEWEEGLALTGGGGWTAGGSTRKAETRGAGTGPPLSRPTIQDVPLEVGHS